MRRREFIKLIGGSVATAWPLAARAQQQAMPVIGFISSRSQKQSTTVVDAFRQGLGDLGYVEGQNVAVEYQWADGQLEPIVNNCGPFGQSPSGCDRRGGR